MTFLQFQSFSNAMPKGKVIPVNDYFGQREGEIWTITRGIGIQLPDIQPTSGLRYQANLCMRYISPWNVHQHLPKGDNQGISHLADIACLLQQQPAHRTEGDLFFNRDWINYAICDLGDSKSLPPYLQRTCIIKVHRYAGTQEWTVAILTPGDLIAFGERSTFICPTLTYARGT